MKRRITCGRSSSAQRLTDRRVRRGSSCRTPRPTSRLLIASITPIRLGRRSIGSSSALDVPNSEPDVPPHRSAKRQEQLASVNTCAERYDGPVGSRSQRCAHQRTDRSPVHSRPNVLMLRLFTNASPRVEFLASWKVVPPRNWGRLGIFAVVDAFVLVSANIRMEHHGTTWMTDGGDHLDGR